MITPDAQQVKQWKEYEAALAKGILPTDSSGKILCEWDILARSDLQIFIWAMCASPKGRDRRPAVIYLRTDGSLQDVKVPKRGSASEIERLFPKEAQAKFNLYTGDSIISGRLKEMYDHIKYRRIHSEEPPLIILIATTLPTPTP
jgi:hypothetical protein